MSGTTLAALGDDVLRLRPPTDADVAAITRICQDPDIQRWTRAPSPYTEDDARFFVGMAAEALADGSGAHLLVTPAGGPTSEVLGAVGVSRDADDGVGELGYWIAPEARGAGVATRAARLLASAAFEHLDVAALHLKTAAANPASNRVAVNVGFRPVGTLRRGFADRRPDAVPGARLDVNLYDLVPDDLTRD